MKRRDFLKGALWAPVAAVAAPVLVKAEIERRAELPARTFEDVWQDITERKDFEWKDGPLSPRYEWELEEANYGRSPSSEYLEEQSKAFGRRADKLMYEAMHRYVDNDGRLREVRESRYTIPGVER